MALTKGTQRTVGAVIGTAFLICAFAVVFLRRSVMQPILKVVQVMERLSHHDLTVELDRAKRKD
jgi:methyl-accepting chemotaxis protein